MTDPASQPDSDFRLVKHNLMFYVDATFLDRGSLYISESAVTWRGENREFSLTYPNICLHAVSENPYGGAENVKFPQPHLFLMVEGDHVWSVGDVASVQACGDVEMAHDAENKQNGAADADEEDDEQKISFCDTSDEKPSTVLRFVPSDHRSLEELYTALADCQALNPDPEDFSESELNEIDEENAEDEDGVIDNEDFDPDNFTSN